MTPGSGVVCLLIYSIRFSPFQLLNKGVQGEKTYSETVPWMESLVYAGDVGPEVCHADPTDDM